MRDCARGSVALAAWVLAGCGTIDGWWADPEVSDCNGRMINTWVDESSCGDCPPPLGTGVVCAAGVECKRGFCDYRSAVHCGVENRSCMGGACIAVPEEADAALPPHGPVVSGDWCNFTDQYVCGFACTVTDGGTGDGSAGDRGAGEDGDAGVGEDPVDEPDEPDDERPAAQTPSWFMLLGQTPGCRGEGEDERCHTGSIEVTDICGEACVVSFDEDIEVMTTELSRAQYRAALCDCADPAGELCADVCADRSRDAMPMTGLNWCFAYEACAAFDGRLPTALDLARIERAADVSADVTTGEPLCHEWRDAIGSAPWIAECVDDRADLSLDRVDGLAGALPIGADVLPVPFTLHHYYGNGREWQADTLEGLTCAAIQARLSPQGDPRALRVARSRSVLGAAGEESDRVFALSPRTRADDLGVRCVRSRRPEPAGELPPLLSDFAICDPAGPIGLRPVRQAQGVPVFRAVRACAGLRGSSEAARPAPALAALPYELIGEPVSLTVYDDRGLVELGQAWLDADEQWWIAEPAVGLDDPLDPIAPITAPLRDGLTVQLALLGEVAPADAGDCLDEMPTTVETRVDGQRLRAFEFALDREQISTIYRWTTPEQGWREACEQLACVDAARDGAACESECPAWRLPILFDLRHVEPLRHRAQICAPVAQ